MHRSLRRTLFAVTALLSAGLPVAAPAAEPPDALRCEPGEFERIRAGDVVSLGIDDVAGPRRGAVRFARRTGGRFLVGGVLEGGGGFSIEDGPGGRTGHAHSTPEGIAWRIRAGGASGARCVSTPMPIGRALCTGRPSAPRSNAASRASDAPPAEVPILSSRPGATAVFYIDFDGEYVVDPGWNGGAPIDARASTLTTSQMREAQLRVAADFAAFDVDVTTDRARWAAAPVGRRMRCVVTPDDTALPGSGGVAYIGTFKDAGQFGVPDDVLCWAFEQSDANSAAEAISHELGHTLGLSHDGRDILGGTEEYYEGHGSGATGWAPIMGAGYTRRLSQWSRGEYLLANNQEDDIAIIAGAENGFGYVPDEAGDEPAAALDLMLDGRRIEQRSVIAGAGDTDLFRISTTGARLRLRADPAGREPGADLALDLLDGSGAVVRTAAPSATLGAALNTRLAAGTWYVRVRGSGRGSPLGNGYTSYGSIGTYRLSGTLK